VTELWRWRDWQALRPIGRVGYFAAWLGLAMLGVGGEQADDRFALAGAVILAAGVATARLNRRKPGDS
jgi:hypothetical protein